MISATQTEINKWEADNFHAITGWEKDLENSTIKFNLADKSEITFKIIKTQ